MDRDKKRENDMFQDLWIYLSYCEENGKMDMFYKKDPYHGTQNCGKNNWYILTFYKLTSKVTYGLHYFKAHIIERYWNIIYNDFIILRCKF